ncbi:MAG: hypothetical protein ACJLS3_08095 [Erythrobacter sp.]
MIDRMGGMAAGVHHTTVGRRIDQALWAKAYDQGFAPLLALIPHDFDRVKAELKAVKAHAELGIEWWLAAKIVVVWALRWLQGQAQSREPIGRICLATSGGDLRSVFLGAENGPRIAAFARLRTPSLTH